MDQSMWRSHAPSRTKSTSCVVHFQYTLCIYWRTNQRIGNQVGVLGLGVLWCSITLWLYLISAFFFSHIYWKGARGFYSDLDWSGMCRQQLMPIDMFRGNVPKNRLGTHILGIFLKKEGPISCNFATWQIFKIRPIFEKWDPCLGIACKKKIIINKKKINLKPLIKTLDIL